VSWKLVRRCGWRLPSTGIWRRVSGYSNLEISRIIVPLSSRDLVMVGHLDPSKRQDPVTQWKCVMSQNSFLKQRLFSKTVLADWSQCCMQNWSAVQNTWRGILVFRLETRRTMTTGTNKSHINIHRNFNKKCLYLYFKQNVHRLVILRGPYPIFRI